MSLFNTAAIPVRRKRPGEYVNGVWTQPEPEIVKVYGTIQPVKGEELRALQEGAGRSVRSAYRIYTNGTLKAAGADQNPDEVEIGGQWHEITSLAIWANGLIPHYRALAVVYEKTK